MAAACILEKNDARGRSLAIDRSRSIAVHIKGLTIAVQRNRKSRNDGWYAQNSIEASYGNRQQADIQWRERGIATTRLIFYWRCCPAGTA